MSRYITAALLFSLATLVDAGVYKNVDISFELYKGKEKLYAASQQQVMKGGQFIGSVAWSRKGVLSFPAVTCQNGKAVFDGQKDMAYNGIYVQLENKQKGFVIDARYIDIDPAVVELSDKKKHRMIKCKHPEALPIKTFTAQSDVLLQSNHKRIPLDLGGGYRVYFTMLVNR